MAVQKEKKENMANIPFRWMRVEEAAQYLRVSTDFLNKARTTKNPNIPFTRIGGRVLYDRHALDSFLESLEEI
ncbi:MAG: hypothetical protein DESF_02581 [Desulfovibrio sp.]